ncbi:MAG: MarR family winged helix-turn-helix transcriptional regulator [Acidimicrobiia bacterium]
MARTRWLSEPERQAWRNLSLMQLQLHALLGRELTGDGLSYQDYLVLASLSDRPDNQARLTDIGRELGWEKSRVSHHITRMESRSLVQRVKCPTDQRGWFVMMTDNGRASIEAAAPAHVAAVRRHFIDLLTPQQLGTLDEIARTVLEHLPSDD